jgi:hypothetical protein
MNIAAMASARARHNLQFAICNLQLHWIVVEWIVQRR